MPVVATLAISTVFKPTLLIFSVEPEATGWTACWSGSARTQLCRTSSWRWPHAIVDGTSLGLAARSSRTWRHQPASALTPAEDGLVHVLFSAAGVSETDSGGRTIPAWEDHHAQENCDD
jgi:hypothetical protein